MSSTKSRTRTSATQMIEASASPLLSNITSTINTSNALQQQYVPSLLKIESVVPTRINATTRNLHRANRLITRSYSTLCGPTTPPTTTTTANAAAFSNGLVNYKNVTKKINTNLHRHKNIISGNYQQQQQCEKQNESPTSKINNSQQQQQQVSETTNVIVENGVHKVRRTTKEKEKHPDRINLDRRGLCTIPVIDNEANLRLLSLQHNLINTFHIPDSEVALADSQQHAAADGVKDNNNNNVPLRDIDNNSNSSAQSLVSNNAFSSYKSSNVQPPMKPLLRQKSRNQLNLNFSANNATKVNGNGVAAATASSSSSSSSFLQKSFMFQGKGSLLKRANSVMINYSPSPPPQPSTMMSNGITATSMQSSIFGTNVQRGKLMATPSFSMMIDTNTMHHEMANNSKYDNNNNNNSKCATTTTPELQIDANNSYMNSFRFNLANLVFLDLYNNQIEKISNLDGLKSLTVLLLGKNRISDITGITSLKQTLRVLDLHGNRITHISQKICQLQELKSLNLAGNLLRQIQANDFAGLCCLKELNLKRNRIKKINVSDDLHNLERLWLCHNELQNIEDMSSIAKSINLKEITIENNPISLAGDCVSFLVSYLPLLVSLNQLQITDQVRRAANAWRKSKENTDQNFQHLSTDVNSNIRREEIISNARTNWELIRSQQANIINGTQRQVNQIKKTIKSRLMSNNSSSSISTGSLSSNANCGGGGGIESGSSNNSGGANNNIKLSRNVIDVPKRHISNNNNSKLLRSTSHENTCSITSEKEIDIDSDYQLPPMMIDQLVDLPKKNSNRSASSTRPNVDSESDFVSDSDEPKSFKTRVPTTPPINSTSATINSKPPSPVEIIIGVNESDDNNEKSHTPPLPPIIVNNNGSSSSSSSSNNEPVAASSPNVAIIEKSEEQLFIKDIQNYNNNTTKNNNNLCNNVNENRTPSPKERATLTIIDIDNTTSGTSLQPTINVETESISSKSKMPSQVELKMLELVDTERLLSTTTTTSKTSPKTGSEHSINTNVTTSSINNNNNDEQQQQRQIHSSQTNHHHPRSRSGARKIGPPLVRSQTARNLSSHINQNQTTGTGNQSANLKKESKKEIDKDREQGGDYLVEILGRYLNVYGVGAIKFVDKNWNTQKAMDVHTVKFSYINFNSIAPILSRIKVRFPNVENYVFRETNIICLGQLNGLADTQGLKSITIDPEGNHLVANNKNWRAYAIWRLSHWGLKQINGMEITDEEILDAENAYGQLSDLVLWSLPETLLNPLFTRLRVDEMLQNSKITPKEWLMKHADESIRLVVGKEALQWKKHNNNAQQDETTVRRKGKIYFGMMMENTVNAVEKLQKLEYLWPNILLEMIRNTLIDYSQIDLYVRNLMNEINSSSQK